MSVVLVMSVRAVVEVAGRRQQPESFAWPSLLILALPSRDQQLHMLCRLHKDKVKTVTINCPIRQSRAQAGQSTSVVFIGTGASYPLARCIACLRATACPNRLGPVLDHDTTVRYAATKQIRSYSRTQHRGIFVLVIAYADLHDTLVSQSKASTLQSRPGCIAKSTARQQPSQ
jgi:hypothetical protein